MFSCLQPDYKEEEIFRQQKTKKVQQQGFNQQQQPVVYQDQQPGLYYSTVQQQQPTQFVYDQQPQYYVSQQPQQYVVEQPQYMVLDQQQPQYQSQIYYSQAPVQQSIAVQQPGQVHSEQYVQRAPPQKSQIQQSQQAYVSQVPQQKQVVSTSPKRHQEVPQQVSGEEPGYIETVMMPDGTQKQVKYVPYDRNVIEYETVAKKIMVPVTKTMTDYYAVEHQVEYIPQREYQTITEYQPVQRTQEIINYIPKQKQIVLTPEKVQEYRISQQPGQTLLYAPQQQYQEFVYSTQPQTQYVVEQPQQQQYRISHVQQQPVEYQQVIVQQPQYQYSSEVQPILDGLQSEVEETLNRIKTRKSVQGIIIINNDRQIVRSYFPNERKEDSEQIAQSIFQVTNKAKSIIRDLNPQNDLTFLRIKSKPIENKGSGFDPKSDVRNATEIMVAPDKDFMLIVIQGPKGDKKEDE